MLAVGGGSRRALVMNLPGTFPVGAGKGFRTAGMAAPGLVPGTEQGWVATSRRGLGPPRGPLSGSFVEDSSCPGGYRLSLPSDRFSLGYSQFRNTSPSILLTILATDLRHTVARTLTRTVEPALTICARFEAAQRALILGVDGATPVRLGPQEWSPWLEFDTDGQRTVTRIKNLTEDPDDPAFFVGPVTALMVDGLAAPADYLERLQTTRPWLSPAADSMDFVRSQKSERLVTLSLEWALPVEAGRVETALALLRESDWTDVVYILGSTDRLHHVLVTEILGSRRAGNEGVIPELAEVYASADRWLGKILAHAGEETVIAVLSDHGSRPGMGFHLNHGPEGTYVFVAPTLPAGTAGPVLAHEDIAPIILAHLGHPTASDLPGVVPDELWPRDADGERLQLPVPIASYAALFDASVIDDADESIDPRVREQLRALGYIH